MNKEEGSFSALGTMFLVWISITAAIGVYYWAEGLNTQPNVATKSVRAFTVEGCDINPAGNPKVEVRNVGSLPINRSIKLYNSQKNYIGYLDFSKAINGSLDPGEADFLDVMELNGTLEEKKTYILLGEGVPEVNFMCH